MYSIYKNAKCIALYLTYKGAYKRYKTICEESDIEKDCVELCCNGDTIHHL